LTSVSERAAKYLAKYLKKSNKSISLKKFLYKIPEPGKRRKRIQRIIYGIYTYWDLIERFLQSAGLVNEKKKPYYMVGAFRVLIDKWGYEQLRKQLGNILHDDEIKALISTEVEFTDDIDRLALTYGYKRWFVEVLSKYFSLMDLEKILEGLNKRVPTWIILNSLRAEENEILKMLETEGYEVIKDDKIPLLYKLAKLSRKIQESEVYKKGLVLPMQKASAAVVLSLNLKDGELLYDACAAPGIKTIFSVILSGGGIRVIALDKSEIRLKRMKALLKHFGVNKNVKVFLGDARFFNPKRSFDKALVDAPCTSTGTIPKNPDIKVKITYEDVQSFAQLQYEILWSVHRIAPENAEIVYATCSIFPEENEFVIKRFLSHEKRVEIRLAELGVSSLVDNLGKRFWPHIHETIGMFYTKLIKLSPW